MLQSVMMVLQIPFHINIEIFAEQDKRKELKVLTLPKI